MTIQYKPKADILNPDFVPDWVKICDVRHPSGRVWLEVSVDGYLYVTKLLSVEAASAEYQRHIKNGAQGLTA